ncbi:MAG: TIGR01777 family oxidoreductase, partial [Chlamydiia bacterium]|nr:TIGR01777 family oxidoreductase [Chlamydiia bacterium]
AYETMVNSQGLNPENAYASEVIDRFKFSLKVPFFIKAYLLSSIKKRIARILKYKHDMIERDIDMINKYPFEKPLKILISGSHGLIGKNLGYFLEFMGHDVWHLCRGMGDNEKTVYWDPKTGECNPRNFEGFDTVIHLAGENIGKGRWTEKKKERILKSRTEGTEALTNVIKGLKSPPKTFISASAIGYYGDCGSAVVDESSDPGKRLFITEVCERWERASKELEEKGIRVVQARFGMVLSSEGGALKKMLTPFKLGFGGRLGNGKQYVSWVAIDDVVGALYHTIMTSSIKGAVNIVSPEPISNETLTKKLAKALNRWQGAPIPEALIRLLMGQKGEELLLTSARVCPTLLQKTHYRFQYPSIDKCFKHVIGYT